MSTALLLLPQIIAALPTIEVGIEHLIAWIQSVRTAAKQSGEWTAQMEAMFLDALIAWAGTPALQPDPPVQATQATQDAPAAATAPLTQAAPESAPAPAPALSAPPN